MVVRALRSAAAARTPPTLVLTAERLAGGLHRRRRAGAADAVRVRSFSALAAIERNRATVTAALDRAGVAYDAPPAPAMRRPRIVVDPAQAEQARAALSGGLGPGTHADAVGPAVLRVWTAQAVGDLQLAGPDLGADVVLSGPGGGAEPAVEAPVEVPLEAPVDFPVDAVYTWVDGSDPQWQLRQQAAWASSHPAEHSRLAANPGRYASREELRYSLRSLEMYAGWVRQVFLVTDRQVPSWLAAEHPGLTVVDHREIFPADGAGLPTFSSHAIEARLHHVPGLAEHYLYLNDDVFFGRPVAPELFFRADGSTRFFVTPDTLDDAPPSAADRPVDAAAKRSRELVEGAYGPRLRMKFQHVAHPQRRDVQLELEQRFAAELERTVRRPFRHPDDVSAAASLAHYVGAATGRSEPGRLRYLYCDIAERRAPVKLHRLARDRDVDMFCLNDVGAASDGGEVAGRHDPDRLVRDFLAGYFPLASRFERDGSAVSGVPDRVGAG